MEFHLQFTPPSPSLEHWPKGIWALYQIGGDQIAERIIFKEIVEGKSGAPHYTGGIIARHSWCGYIGSFHTLAEAAAEIANRQPA